MTISTSYAALTYAGDGATVALPITWPFFESNDLVVTLIDADGIETVQTLTTHYTVSGGTDGDGLPATGTVTMVTAAASGETVQVERQTDKTQASQWTTSGPFLAKQLEAALDKITLLIQERAADGGSGGNVMRLETAGATDYWDAQSYIIRNVADGVSANDAVNVSQLSEYTNSSFGLPTTATTSTTIDTGDHIVMANNAAATVTVDAGAIYFWLSRSSVSAADVTVVPPSGKTIQDNSDGIIINAPIGAVGFIVDPANADNYITFTPDLTAFGTSGPVWVGVLTVAQLAALSGYTAGAQGYASDGRKNGEGAASGTGVNVFLDGAGAWIAVDTGATVAA